MPKIKVQKKSVIRSPQPVQQEYPNFVTGGTVGTVNPQIPQQPQETVGVNTVVTQPTDPSQFRQGMEAGTFAAQPPVPVPQPQEYPNFVTGGTVNVQPQQPIAQPVQQQEAPAPRFETVFVGDLPQEQQQEFEPIPAGVTIKKGKMIAAGGKPVYAIQDPNGIWHVSPNLTDQDLRSAGIDPSQFVLEDFDQPGVVAGQISSEILPHNLQGELQGFRERSRALQRAGTPLTQQKNVPQPIQQPQVKPQETQEMEQQKKTESLNKDLQSFGISSPDPKTVTNPRQTIQSLTQEITKSLNLPDYKSRLDEIAKSRTEIMGERDRKVGEVNDNPWISEAQRSRQVSRVNETYEGKLANKTAEYTLLQSTFDDARQQAEFVTSKAIDLYQGEQRIAQQNQQFYIDTALKVQEAQRQLEKEKFAREKPIEVSQGAVLIDPTTGNIIGRGLPKEEGLPTSYQEYQLAKKEGFKGTYNDYQTLDANRKAKAAGTGLFQDINMQLKNLQLQQAQQNLLQGTQAQNITATYANRIEQAGQIFDSLEKDIAKYGAAGYATQRALPNWAPGKDPNIQSQEQAERNFVNAVLRRESGAVISPSEFVNAQKQYFPQPGDGEKVLKQKKANRKLVEQSFIRGSGPAFIHTDQPKKVIEGVTKSKIKYKVLQ